MTYRPNYQRGVGGGRTVDTGPPRTNTGLTGLGAVGGATGVGAGALRVIVEFLSQYDSKDVEKLEADLTNLQNVEKQFQQFLGNEAATRAKEEEKLTQLTQLRHRANATFTQAQKKELKTISDMLRSQDKDVRAAAGRQARALAEQSGFTRQQIRALATEQQIRSTIEGRRLKYLAAAKRAEAEIAGIQQQQLAVGRQLSFLQNLRANLGPKLGSLALGAVGGVFGGAIVGLGFTAAQGLIDAIGGALQDIVDPSHKARDALEGVVDEIQKMAESEGLTFLQAAERRLRDLGAAGEAIDPKILASAAAIQQLIERNKELADILEVVRHSRSLEIDNLKETIRLTAEALGLGSGPSTQARILGTIRPDLVANAEGIRLTAEEERILSAVQEDLALTSEKAAVGARQLALAEQGAAGAAALAAANQQRFVDAVQRASNLRISGLQDQLSSLGGPSARTQGILDQISAMGEASAQAAYQRSLANIQEQRAAVLLEQRIRFQGESVRLDQLSSRLQIVAIDARISALQRAGEAERAALDNLNAQIEAARRADAEQDRRDREALKVYDDRIEAINKEGEAQDRLNRLLDLQYRLGQDITRNQGESIEDFLQRRANETRGLLAEQAALSRDNQIAGIQAERDQLAATQEAANATREAAIEAMELQARQLQDRLAAIEKQRQAEIQALNDRKAQLELQVRLEDLAAQEQQVIAQETQRKKAQALQQELEDSQRRDQEELESRREAIEQLIQAERDRAERAQRWLDTGEQEKLRSMIAAARTQADASGIIGEVVGARRAYEELKAYLTGLGLNPFEVSSILAPLKELVDYANSRLSSIKINSPGAGPRPLAKGGVFMLNNAVNNPFGANIRTGEEGDEIGVVLSNKVASILKSNQRQAPPISLTMYEARDPWRDMRRARRMIVETLEEELG